MSPSPDVLAVVGDLLEDVVVWLEGPTQRGTDNAGRIYRSMGGSAANVAAAAAVPCRFLGAVGDDPLGDRLVAELGRRGVDVRAQRAGRTGTVVVLVEPGGERTMIPDRAACADLGPLPADALSGVGLLHAPAYGLTCGRTAESLRALLGAAKDCGVPVSLDASSTAVLRTLGTGAFRDLVAHVQPLVLFANVDEARLLRLRQEPPAGVTVLVKDGPRPTTVLTADGQVLRLPVPAVDGVRDSTGAGDAFAAGYLSALLRGAGVVACVEHGHALAATGLRRPGAATVADPAGTP